MKKINCLVADDERLAREVLTSHVRKIDRLHLVATCADGLAVFNALQSHAIDLLFLDLKMPQLSGIELLRTLKKPPAVIITTAYREFALEGYELNVIDYLLKPVAFERFLKAIDKYEQGMNPARSLAELPPADKITPPAKAFIYVKSAKKMVKLLLADITYLEGLKDYVKIHTTDGAIVTHQTLTYFEEKLAGDQFLRVHRSFIVSHHHITAYSATSVEVGPQRIPIGESYAREVSRILQAGG